MTEQPRDPLQTLWQSQAEELHMSRDQIADASRRFERMTRRRNLREYAAAAIVVAAFTRSAFVAPSGILQLAAVLTVAAALFVAWQLRIKGSGRTLPADYGQTDALAFYRVQLTRQRDMLRGAWAWYVLPFVPGVVMTHLGWWRLNPERAPQILVMAAFVTVVLIAIGVINRRGAARIQRRLDRL